MSFKVILFMWQFGLIDTFSAVSFMYNVGAQYSSIVVAALVDGNATKLPTIIFEPIVGLGVSYQFVKAATAAEQRARVATLAALLSTSTTLAVTSNPAANAGIGGAIAGHIAHMREVLGVRGGSLIGSVVKDSKIVLDPVNLPVHQIHPFCAEFTANSKIIIDNMFQEHTARRCLQGSAAAESARSCLYQKLKGIQPTCLAPIALTQINCTALIGWFSGVGLVGLTTLGALCLFQYAERRRWQNQNDEVVIDVTASLVEGISES